MAAIISGRVYRFPPNEINVKSLSLILVDRSYITTSRDTAVTRPNLIPDLWGRSDWMDYIEKGEPTYVQALAIRGVYAVKAEDDHVCDRSVTASESRVQTA